MSVSMAAPVDRPPLRQAPEQLSRPPAACRGPWMRATYTCSAGVRRLFAPSELGENKLYGTLKRASLGLGS